MSRILLVGRTGQVGSELLTTLAPLGTIVAPSRAELDLAHSDAIAATVRDARPEIIVNAAAYTDVERAEDEREAAFNANATAPGILAEEAARCGALLVHYSTDYVFDGTKAGAYDEDDPVAPLNVYGESKLAGEQAVAASGARHLILRLSWVYGLRGANFPLKILAAARSRDELRVVCDQTGAPTWSRDIATATAAVLTRMQAGSFPDRILLHAPALGSTSWYGFAEALFDAAPLALLPRRPRLVPVTAAEYGAKAPRPRNSRLSADQLAATFGLRLPHWRDGLRRWAVLAGTA